MDQNYYLVLQISPTSSFQEIKKSFRKLSKEYHPDLNNGSHEFDNKFIDILKAYEVLSDIEKREEYDKWLSDSNNIDYSYPYEPKYRTVNDVIKITKDLKNELFKHDPKEVNIDVNLVYNIINHVLNPDFIYTEINSKDKYSKAEIVTNIVNCYIYLPLSLIQLIQIKVDLIDFKDKEIQTFARKIILRKKILEDEYGIVKIISVVVLILVIVFIGWIVDLLK
jgi:hypothetical protein